MSKFYSPEQLEAKVNLQMEKFILRQNTSHRRLLREFSSKVINSELTFLKKFRRPTKIIVGEGKTAHVFNSHESSAKLGILHNNIVNSVREKRRTVTFDEESLIKFSRKPKLTLSSPRTNLNLLSSCRTSTSKLPVTPLNPILEKYDTLVRSITETKPVKVSIKNNSKKKARKIFKSIDMIGNDRQYEKDIKQFDKKFEKKYLKEALKEMKTERQYTVKQQLSLNSMITEGNIRKMGSF